MPGLIEDMMTSSGTKGFLEFADSEGKPVLFFFPYWRPGAGAYNVKNLIQAILDNGSIFKDVPVTYVNNVEMTTSYTHYEIDI